MALTQYQRDKVTNFTSLVGDDINGELLNQELIDNPTVPHANLQALNEGITGDTKVDFWFDPALTGAEETALDVVVAAHTGNPYAERFVKKVLDRDLTVPPVTPTESDRYIVATGATGAWAGQDLNIAQWDGSAWYFYSPREGTIAWVDDEDAHLYWNGTRWAPLAGEASYAELYESNDTGTPYSVTAGVWEKWTSSTVGDEAGTNFAAGSAATDKITIGAYGGGAYKVSANASVKISNGSLTAMAVYKNGTRLDDIRTADEKSSNQRLDLSVDGLVDLVSSDEIELYFMMTTGASLTLTVYRANINVIRVGPSGDGAVVAPPSFDFSADQLLSPVSDDWAVNALAPLAVDSNNSGLPVRRFDDTAEEGAGLEGIPPSGTTKLKIKFISRAETAPAAARTVGPKLYNRGIPSTVEAWDTGTVLADLDFSTNEEWQYNEQTLTLAALNITAGEETLFELTRVAPGGGTNLEGDWTLLYVGGEWI